MAKIFVLLALVVIALAGVFEIVAAAPAPNKVDAENVDVSKRCGHGYGFPFSAFNNNYCCDNANSYCNEAFHDCHNCAATVCDNSDTDFCRNSANCCDASNFYNSNVISKRNIAKPSALMRRCDDFSYGGFPFGGCGFPFGGCGFPFGGCGFDGCGFDGYGFDGFGFGGCGFGYGPACW